MGCIYTRGEIYWIKYYANGRAIRESTRQTKEKRALDLLKEREGRVRLNMALPLRTDRITFFEAADALVKHYEATGDREIKEAKGKLKPVRAHFDHHRLHTIDEDAVDRYVAKRQAAGLSNATVNRELSILGKALRLAEERKKLLRVPRIHLLKESSPRAGFFERADFERVRRHLGKRPDLQLAINLAYTYGWRMQSEIMPLELGQIDLTAGTIRLEPGSTKNGQGRVVYLTPELIPLLKEQIERVKALSRKLNRVVSYLFPNPRRGRWQGERLRDFRKAWTTACDKAGLAGAFRHDFRRTAVRNLVRSGVPETVAMKITGHKTRSVFDRYNIVSDRDLRDAAQKLHGHNLGTMPSPALDTPRVSMRKSKHAPVAQLDRAAVS